MVSVPRMRTSLERRTAGQSAPLKADLNSRPLMTTRSRGYGVATPRAPRPWLVSTRFFISSDTSPLWLPRFPRRLLFAMIIAARPQVAATNERLIEPGCASIDEIVTNALVDGSPGSRRDESGISCVDD